MAPTLSVMTLNDEDWALAYQVAATEIARRGLTKETFAKAAGLHRSTLSRMREGDRLADESLWKIEGNLGWPRDLLTYIARHDIDLIREAVAGSPDRVDPDLLRWLTRKLDETNGPQAS